MLTMCPVISVDEMSEAARLSLSSNCKKWGVVHASVTRLCFRAGELEVDARLCFRISELEEDASQPDTVEWV